MSSVQIERKQAMQLSEEERRTIGEAAKSLGIRRVYVFGSALDDSAEPADLDLAVEGVPRGALFKFYGQALRRLRRRLDVVDISVKNPVTELISQEAVIIYG